MYDAKSMKAEEFIDHNEIMATLEYAAANKNNAALISEIIEKAKLRKGLSHREAAVLLVFVCPGRQQVVEHCNRDNQLVGSRSHFEIGVGASCVETVRYDRCPRSIHGLHQVLERLAAVLVRSRYPLFQERPATGCRSCIPARPVLQAGERGSMVQSRPHQREAGSAGRQCFEDLSDGLPILPRLHAIEGAHQRPSKWTSHEHLRPCRDERVKVLHAGCPAHFRRIRSDTPAVPSSPAPRRRQVHGRAAA